MLIIDYSVGPAISPDETIMPHLSCLTGLKELHLYMNNITHKGLQHIKGLKSLKKLVLAVEKQFGDAALAELSELRSLEVLAFSGSRTDSSLRHLTKLTSLRELRLDVSEIRGPGLAHLEKLPSLKYLIISGKNFGDGGLAYITNLKSLRRLKLWGSELQITDAGLSQLVALPNLTNLHVYSFAEGESALDISGLTKLQKLEFAWSCPIRDKDLAFLGELKQLRRLRINSSKTITDSGMAHLAGLTSLNSLSLYGNLDLTDDGLLYLSGMKRLGFLALCGDFTDAGLRRLEGFTSIDSLHITSKRRFSAAAIRRLRRKLPNLGTFQIQLKDSFPRRSNRRR